MSTQKKAGASKATPRNGTKASALKAPARGARTRVLNIRASLEQDIVSGKFTPGMKLDEEALAARYGASRTPVREAFQQLASQGHIELRPHMGAYVAQLGVSELGQMFETMAFLESACAELAALRHTAEDRQLLADAHDACVRAAKKKDPDAFYVANANFHERIYVASHNDYLCADTLRLRNRLEAYRRASTFHAGLMALTIKEHEKILQAILDMEETAAAARMRGHLDTLRDDAVSMTKALKRVTENKAA
jgi:DNA-binding GntR family transcriptional regulator